MIQYNNVPPNHLYVVCVCVRLNVLYPYQIMIIFYQFAVPAIIPWNHGTWKAPPNYLTENSVKHWVLMALWRPRQLEKCQRKIWTVMISMLCSNGLSESEQRETFMMTLWHGNLFTLLPLDSQSQRPAMCGFEAFFVVRLNQACGGIFVDLIYGLKLMWCHCDMKLRICNAFLSLWSL